MKWIPPCSFFSPKLREWNLFKFRKVAWKNRKLRDKTWRVMMCLMNCSWHLPFGSWHLPFDFWTFAIGHLPFGHFSFCKNPPESTLLIEEIPDRSLDSIQMCPDAELKDVADHADDPVLDDQGMWVFVLKLLMSWFGKYHHFMITNCVLDKKQQKVLPCHILILM